jgi:hypothetical protein
MSYEAPLLITIPIPTEIDVGYGVNSTGKRGGNLRVRCTNKEYDAIQVQAKLLGITLAMFCRWCAVEVSKKLDEHRDAGSTSMSIGEENESHKPRRTKKKRKTPRAKR